MKKIYDIRTESQENLLLRVTEVLRDQVKEEVMQSFSLSEATAFLQTCQIFLIDQVLVGLDSQILIFKDNLYKTRSSSDFKKFLPVLKAEYNREDVIAEFPDDKTALTWYKLNY